MKLTLALFMCYVTYVTATPTCSPEELRKCNTHRKDYIKTEAEVEKYCQSFIKCSLDYWDRCGTRSKYETSLYNWYKKMYKGVCEIPRPFRQKYIENSKCLYGAINELPVECWRVDGKYPDKNTLCKLVEKITNCSEDLIEDACGRDGRVLFKALYIDTKEIFEC